MAKVSVYDINGKEVDTLELNDAIFGVNVNEHLVHFGRKWVSRPGKFSSSCTACK